MSEEEMKKWRIDLVQRTLESTIQRYELERARIRSLTDLVENTLTTWRNAVLAGFVLAASIILGLSSVDLFKEFILRMLVADILVGLIAFIVFTVIKGKVHAVILSTDGLYYLALDRLNTLKYAFMLRMYHIDKIEHERIYFFLTYSIFASLAVRVHLIDVLENISSSVFFRKIRFRIRGALEAQKVAVNTAMNIYEKRKSSWTQYSSDLQEFNSHLEDFFKYHTYRR